MREKAAHAVLVKKDEELAKYLKDMSTMKVITTATMVERFGVNGSLARRLMKHACEEKVVICVDSQLPLYTRNRGGDGDGDDNSDDESEG